MEARIEKTWLVNGKFKMMNPLNQNYGHFQALISIVGKKYEQRFFSIIFLIQNY
jgi:hypothetical protein